jgi:hypothetical protein
MLRLFPIEECLGELPSGMCGSGHEKPVVGNIVHVYQCPMPRAAQPPLWRKCQKSLTWLAKADVAEIIISKLLLGGGLFVVSNSNLAAELKKAPQRTGSRTFIPACAPQRRPLRAVRRSPRSPARRRCTSSPARNARQSAPAHRAPWSRSPRRMRRWDGQARWRRHSGWSSPC